VLARNTLDDGFDASPALAGNDIYLRGYKYLYAIGSR
jgi:outer membrane protein assembly factor BamB